MGTRSGGGPLRALVAIVVLLAGGIVATQVSGAEDERAQGEHRRLVGDLAQLAQGFGGGMVLKRCRGLGHGDVSVFDLFDGI